MMMIKLPILTSAEKPEA